MKVSDKMASANSADLYQTAPGAVWSESILPFHYLKYFKKQLNKKKKKKKS